METICNKDNNISCNYHNFSTYQQNIEKNKRRPIDFEFQKSLDLVALYTKNERRRMSYRSFYNRPP